MAKTWTAVLESRTGLLNIPFKEIKQYRGMMLTLVKRDYQLQYKQTILGPLWMIFNLVLNTGIFSLIFGYIGKFSSDGTPYFLFYMTGSIAWEFFSGCFYSNTNVLQDNAYLYGKVYFPRLIIPISNMLFQYVKTLVKFIVTALVWVFFFLRGETEFMGWYLLLLIPVTAIAGIMGTAMGLIVACASVKYRDFSHGTGILMTLLMYASPVIYSANEIPDWLQGIVYINPVSSLIETFRYAMTGAGVIHWGYLIYSLIFALVLGFISLIIFNQTEKTFVDII